MAKPSKARSKKKPGKSEGESLESVYERLSEMLTQFAPPFKFCPFVVTNKMGVQLVVPKPVVIPGAYGGKPTQAVLAAAILQKGYVGFYLMGIYTNPERKKQLSPELLKLLKGKSCFHVMKLDDGLVRDMEAAVGRGAKDYQARGWV